MKLKLIITTTITVWAVGVLSLAAQATKSQWDGVYTVEQAARGEALYTQKGCILCHNRDLYGFSPDMNLGPALIDIDFEKDWDGATVGELYEKIRKTMPRNDPGTLNDQEAADLLSFILQKGKYPAGTAELGTDVDQLKTFKFLAKKPA